jgi:hypothetical protein
VRWIVIMYNIIYILYMSTLIVICSKSPNNTLPECVELLYKIQIDQNSSMYKMCIIDSDSDDFTNYETINKNFPEVKIHYVKNKNFEYGAWKYALELYPDYDNYFCIQDSMLINKPVDLSVINDKCAYIWKNKSGYKKHMSIKGLGIENLKTTELDYKSVIDTEFALAFGNIFIVNNNTLNDIFKTLRTPPVNKEGSCFYERNFGIYFILKNIDTVDLKDNLSKINCHRH